MTTPNISKLLLFCFMVFAALSCSENEAQQKFEEEALAPPAGIETMDQGPCQKNNEENDPSDWRTAPDFSGLFSVVTPACPNPVAFNAEFEIVIDVKVIDAVNGLYVYAFQQPGQLIGPLNSGQTQPSIGQQTIRIQPAQFSSSTGVGNSQMPYRIIMFDNREKVITYGDVLID